MDNKVVVDTRYGAVIVRMHEKLAYVSSDQEQLPAPIKINGVALDFTVRLEKAPEWRPTWSYVFRVDDNLKPTLQIIRKTEAMCLKVLLKTLAEYPGLVLAGAVASVDEDIADVQKRINRLEIQMDQAIGEMQQLKNKRLELLDK